MLLTMFGALIYTFIVGVEAELLIRNSGIEHIDRLDVGMVFSNVYPEPNEVVEIENEGKEPIILGTRMIDCCENITPEDIDCEHIQLIGGDMGTLNPRGVRNLTLVWPTLYLHERRGECNVAITYGTRNNETGEIQHRVRFDTSVSPRGVPAILEGYYETLIVKKCPSVDLDPLDHCRPLNCHVKYNGRRNFYNRKLQRCQPVPICIADTAKELPDVGIVEQRISRSITRSTNLFALPDKHIEVFSISQGYIFVSPPNCHTELLAALLFSFFRLHFLKVKCNMLAYVPVSNSCRDLENAVNEMEIRALSRGEVEPAWGSEPSPRMMNMYCHHGYNENVTGFCICDDGWTSQPLRNLEPSNEFIHMCNVQITRFPSLRDNPLEIIVFVMAGLLGTLVFVSCCAMAFLMRGFIPPGSTVDCGQQTGGAVYSDSSTKTCTTYSSNKKNQKLDCRNSSPSCPGLR